MNKCKRCGKYISQKDKKIFEEKGICKKCLSNIKLDDFTKNRDG